MARSAPKKESALHFQLVDFRVKSAKCDSPLHPDEAPRGRFDTDIKGEITLLEPAKDGPKGQILRARIDLSLIGHRIAIEEGKAEKDATSFTINVIGEATFAITGGKLNSDMDLSPAQVDFLMSGTFPLVMTKVREYAADLGYRSVRPTLNFGPKDKYNISESPPSPTMKP